MPGDRSVNITGHQPDERPEPPERDPRDLELSARTLRARARPGEPGHPDPEAGADAGHDGEQCGGGEEARSGD